MWGGSTHGQPKVNTIAQGNELPERIPVEQGMQCRCFRRQMQGGGVLDRRDVLGLMHGVVV